MTQIISVLGLDHGKITGAALFNVAGDRLELAQQFQAPWQDVVVWAGDVARQWFAGSLLIAAERFVISQGTLRTGRSDENWTIEGIGCARRDASFFGHPFVLKGASDAKKFASNEKLKQAGWDRPSPGNHMRDATRIAVLAAADELGTVPPWV